MNTESAKVVKVASVVKADPSPAVQAAAAGTNDTAPKPQLARVSSQTLFCGGAREVEIEHHGALYRLRQTALGKLILTK